MLGQDLSSPGADVAQLRRDIGYLPSEVFYYERMKVIDLLKYSASFYERDCTQRMNELAELMELEMGRRIEDLSYGNRKKVGIVQGLLHQPKLLFLDEPTAGLDPQGRRQLLDLILGLHRTGITLVIISHNMEELAAICDRLYVITDGRTAMQGSPAEIFGHAQELRGMGLDAPAVAMLMDRLAEQGLIRPGPAVYTVEQAEAFLAALLGAPEA